VAVWALARLAPADAFRAEAAARAGDESDPAVVEKWQVGLSESRVADEADAKKLEGRRSAPPAIAGIEGERCDVAPGPSSLARDQEWNARPKDGSIGP
jgi:hypothetical protein